MLTPDQITAIAPDAPSLKAGRDLGTARKWQSIGGGDAVLWGLAMGSGKDPYQTRVALADLASKCSCPSRKFPCKHAIGLMFLATGDPAALTQKEHPPWVTEWLDSAGRPPPPGRGHAILAVLDAALPLHFRTLTRPHARALAVCVPPRWKLSPWAVTDYLLGKTLPDGTVVSPKYIGDRRILCCWKCRWRRSPCWRMPRMRR